MGAAIAFVAERFSFGRPVSIDREKGIVRGVRVLNAESRNDRVYPESVLRDCLKVYANLPVNVGHHYDPATMLPREVPPSDRFGRLGPNPVIESGGITSDYLQFNPEHPFAKPFLWACENQPDLYSFSPLHRVKWARQRDGKNRLVAESILEAASADIVSDGGTTSTIFESRQWVSEMTPDPEAIASSLETDGAVIAFLTDLFAKLKVSSQSTKDTITSLVTSAMSGNTDAAAAGAGDGADAAAAAPAMEALRRLGPVGKWAATRLDAHFVAEAAKRREKWASELIKSEQLADSLVSPVFVTMVAESFGNEAKAKELIADRKKLGGTGGTGGANNGGSGNQRTGAKSVEELVAGYVAG
jgi:hypothetical protein